MATSALDSASVSKWLKLIRFSARRLGIPAAFALARGCDACAGGPSEAAKRVIYMVFLSCLMRSDTLTLCNFPTS